MVVITIIALVIGIALPNYLRMKADASQAAAIKALRTLGEVFEEFWIDQNPHRYPADLGELDAVPAVQGAPKYIAETIPQNKVYQGYYFSVVTPDTQSYSIQATPINPNVTGLEIYAIATSGGISSAILVCPSGNTLNNFKELTSDAAPSISIHPGHPHNSGEIPPQYQ